MSYSCIEVESRKHELFELCQQIRIDVFVNEQGVDQDVEMDGIDDYAQHFLITLRGEDGDKLVPVATMRIFPCEVLEQSQKLILKVGRIAVARDYRKHGIGRLLMDSAENYAITQGRGLEKPGVFLFMHSQTDAQGFYKKCGYSIVKSIEQLDDLVEGKLVREPDDKEMESLQFIEDGINHVRMCKYVQC